MYRIHLLEAFNLAWSGQYGQAHGVFCFGLCMMADSCDDCTQRCAQKLLFARERVLHVAGLVERWLVSQGAQQ
jgi:hypothetical protein